jgi:hypothetical protein
MRAMIGLTSRAVLLLALCGGVAHADPAAGKPNGDSPSDLAPLDQSGHSADQGPMAHANTPPIGGATQGGGANPKELGTIDAHKDNSQDPGNGKNQGPDKK